jgi:thioredoxin reductase
LGDLGRHVPAEPGREKVVGGLQAEMQFGFGADAKAGRVADGSERLCDGLLVPVTLRQRSALADQLGAAASGPGLVAVDAVEVDPTFQTTAPGLSAAGDVCSQLPSMANAIAAGSSAAATIVHSLTAEAYGLSPP